jgi:hypothetical protein
VTRLLLAASVLVAAFALACGGDDDDSGDDGATGGEESTAPTVLATPVEEFVVVGNCPAEPAPTGEPVAVIPGLLVVGFAPTTTIEAAQAFLDMYVTDYRIGQNAFEGSRVAIICVAPGTENDVTRLLPLGGDLRFVQRYRVSAGF